MTATSREVGPDDRIRNPLNAAKLQLELVDRRVRRWTGDDAR